MAVELKLKINNTHTNGLVEHNQRICLASASSILSYSMDWTILDSYKDTRKLLESLEILQQPQLMAILGDSTLSLHKMADLRDITLSIKNVVAISTLNSTHSSLSAEAAMQGRKRGTSKRRIRLRPIDPLETPTPIQSLLAVVTKRKVSVYTWTQDTAQHTDIPLPNTPKLVKILNPYTTFIAYSASEYSLIQFDIKSQSVYSINDVILPSTNKSSLTANLTGFLYRSKPLMTPLDSEHIILVDGTQVLVIDQDGVIAKSTTIPASADDIASARPFIYITIPPYSNETGSTHVYSSYTLELVQVLPVVCSFLHKSSSVLYVDAPDGVSTIELVNTKLLIDSSVKQGKYDEALALLDSGSGIDITQAEQAELRLKILQLYSISLVDAGLVDDAIDIFIELHTNPAKVIALFPENISGRLYTPTHEWSILFGDFAKLYKHVDERGESECEDAIHNSASMSSIKSDTDSASVKSNGTARTAKKEKSSIEALLRYLTDRRQKLKGSMSQKKHSACTSLNVKLTDLTKQQLLDLPSSPAESLNGSELAVLAAVVDTALFKAYIETRPALVGSLCRLENHCQPEEVEVSLLDRRKYSELVSLYKSKNMHGKALDLLKRLCLESESETENENGNEESDLEPCIAYTQQLGREYIDLILDKSRWMFDVNKDIAIQIFIADDERVESLPRLRVAHYLHDIDSHLSLRYLKYATEEINDQDPALHDYYADALLQATLHSRNTPSFDSTYASYVAFLSRSQHYAPKERLRGIPADALLLARAILADRLGRHDDALRLYALDLRDYDSAKKYCNHVESKDRSIYTKLLKLYLRCDERTAPASYYKTSSASASVSPSPTPSRTPISDDTSNPLNAPNALYMKEAVLLLTAFPTKFNLSEVLNLIPSITTVDELNVFLLRSYKAIVGKQRWNSVTANIRKAEDTRLAAKLVDLESRYVVVDDNRVCPECLKRLGNSVISVHSPRGQVTHLGCKDRFSVKLQRTQGYTKQDTI
ncbi:hypothetical protein E3P98_02781 [Wallemia ichthyophaga]|nr:hypothetical protein E3P98_02781 [Wallemia ichthyophaga]